MIKSEDSSSMYDFVDDNHTAPVAEQPVKLVREQNWQSSNNERFKQDLPQHVQDAMTVTQQDFSYYAFQRFAFGHPVKDNFEQQVNKQCGKLEKGFDFKSERERYQKLYRNLMG